MGRGGRRAGAGRKPKALAELRLAGGFRRTRHAALLQVVPDEWAQVPAATVAPSDALPVPATVLDGLAARGAAFVTATWAEAEGWSTGELALLRLAGRTLDDVDAAPNATERGRAIRVFAAIVGQLGLDKLGGRT